jgi:hypothetical protein
MSDATPDMSLLESAWGRALLSSPLWLLRGAVSLMGAPADSPFVLGLDAALLAAGVWLVGPLWRAQGAAFPDKRSLATLPVLFPVYAVVLAVQDVLAIVR